MRALNQFCQLCLTIILGILIIASCKKKSDEDTTTVPCAAVSNLNPSIINGFDRPVAIAFSSTGKVVVTEDRSYDADLNVIPSAPAPVYVFSNSTDLANFLPLQIINGIVGPEAATFDSNDNLYITETEVQAGVSIYEPPYIIKLKTIQPGWNNPRGIALDASGNLYLADDSDNKIVKISNPLGTEMITDFITGLNHPKAISISGNNLFIAEYDENKISRYNLSNSQLIESFTATQPIDLGINGCMLYATLHNGNANGDSKVIALKSDNLKAGIQKEYAGFTGGAFGVTADKIGDLLVADFKSGVLRKYSK